MTPDLERFADGADTSAKTNCFLDITHFALKMGARRSSCGIPIIYLITFSKQFLKLSVKLRILKAEYTPDS